MSKKRYNNKSSSNDISPFGAVLSICVLIVVVSCWHLIILLSMLCLLGYIVYKGRYIIKDIFAFIAELAKDIYLSIKNK